MEKVNAFLKRKNIVFSAKRYGIDALGAMAQGLFCSLLIGTILNTLGTQFHIGFLTAQIGEKVPYTVGGLTSFMSGPAMAIAIGYALQAPPLVLFSLAAVGYACNLLGGAGGIEAVFTALALRDQFAPPTIHYEQPDPECDLDYVPNVGREMKMEYALSNSLGFGGHNACIALRRWEG